MKIIKISVIAQQIDLPKNRSAKDQVEAWINDFKYSNYRNPAEIKKKYASASFLGNNTVIFNIKGNEYRLIVRMAYGWNAVFFIWFGNHREYDNLKKIETLKHQR